MSAWLFQRFARKDNSYKPMSDEALLEIARQIYASPDFRPVLDRVGLHGDLSDAEEEAIDQLIIAQAERTMEAPQPENLTIPLALARRFAAGVTDPADTKAGLAFVADRRCDGLSHGPGPWRTVKLSELLPILRNLDAREDLKAPFTQLRSRTFRRGENFFEDDEALSISTRISLAIHREQTKYALLNRDEAPISKIEVLFGMYGTCQINNLDDDAAVEYLLRGNKSPNKQFHIIDDRNAP